MILSVDGESDPIKIRNFVDNEFLSRDSLAFREHIEKISPDIDLTYSYYSESTGEENEIVLPMSVQFFWPRAWIQAHTAPDAIWDGISFARGFPMGGLIRHAYSSEKILLW